MPFLTLFISLDEIHVGEQEIGDILMMGRHVV